MYKRLNLGYITLFLVAIAMTAVTGVYFSDTTKAVGRTSPENGFYNMRYHDSGNVLQTTLAIYSRDRNKPSNATFTISRLGDTDLNCDPSSINDDIRLRISLGSTTPYNRKLSHNSCEKNQNTSGQDRVYKTYSIGDDQWQLAEGGRYRVNLTLALSGGGGDSSIYTNKATRAWFQFRATASSGLWMTNTSNAFGSSGYKTNYGVTGGSDRDWGDNNDGRTLYEMAFARPCTTGVGDTIETVGMWDPDKFYNRIKVQESPRTGTEDWSDTSITSRTGMNGGENGAGYYTPNNGDGVNAYLQFRMKINKKYRVVLVTDIDNVVSLFWPYDSINAEIGCQYTLNPSIATGGRTTVDPGSSVTVSTPVINSDPEVYNTDTTRRTITKFVYNARPTMASSSFYNQNVPCAAYTASNREGCFYDWAPGTNEVVSLGLSSNPAAFTYVASTAEIGKYVCFTNSVSWPQDNISRDPSRQWRHSSMQCMLVAKRPKVQVLGSDLRVRRDSPLVSDGRINTSISEGIGGRTYGSWIEYGVFSTGINQVAGSGSGLRNGSPSPLSAKGDWSRLTFSNNASTLGSYSPVGATNAPSYFGNLSTEPSKTFTSSMTNIDLSTQDGVYKYNGTGTLNISVSGEIPKNRSIIIIAPNRRVIIDSDVAVVNNYNSVKEISQVVILAKDIDIPAGVTRVDAWLMGTNSINTCSDKPNPRLVVGDCSRQLIVNGPAATEKLYLYRTYGSDAATPGEAAEVFNLRASTYIWAYNYVNKQDRAQTVLVTELPPRL